MYSEQKVPDLLGKFLKMGRKFQYIVINENLFGYI
jgi:hypothetical protein